MHIWFCERRVDVWHAAKTLTANDSSDGYGGTAICGHNARVVLRAHISPDGKALLLDGERNV
jgi:hypothetical protein